MMNQQQRRELSSSAREIVPGQLSYRQLSPARLSQGQWRRSWQRRIGGSRLRLLIIISLVFLLVVWRTAANLHYQHPALSPHHSAPFVPQIDRLLTNQVAHEQFSGSVLIAQAGQVLLSKGYSMADWDKQVPNTPHTKFYVGSTTKQFTAMAILILQDQGKLHVRDSVCSHIVPCPGTWQSVTIHDLLTHTSGIPQLGGASLSTASPQAWIASFSGNPLVSTPGRQFSYCNVCYQILGYVVEQASGKPYSQFLQQAIFGPLQMRNTGFDPHYLSLPDHAVGYASWRVRDIPIGWDVAPEWSFLFGAGLLYSTVEDMYRWDQALSRHTLVSQQSLNEAFTPYIASQYAGSSYGYGWFIAQAPTRGHRLIWHFGAVDGFRSYIGRYPEDGITIIILSNLSTVDELTLAHTLQQLIFPPSSRLANKSRSATITLPLLSLIWTWRCRCS